jgi:1-acyl-sn-glycerol-3-phosphate acyltransferase
MIIQSITQVTSVSRPAFLILIDIILENVTYYLKLQKENLQTRCLTIILKSTYVCIAKPLTYYYKINSTIPKELLHLEKGRYIIVANHHKAIDAYIILASLPYSLFKTLLPIRFFVANMYLRQWWQKLFLASAGAFKAYSEKGTISGVKGGIYFLDKGQSLFIFPQGKRVQKKTTTDLKVGIGYIAKKRVCTILPVAISYTNNKTIVSWGKPYVLNEHIRSKDVTFITKSIFKKVQTLAA